MNEKPYEALIKELAGMPFFSEDRNKLMFMMIMRLDRIAYALESLQGSTDELAGCISPLGSFCVAGDMTVTVE